MPVTSHTRLKAAAGRLALLAGVAAYGCDGSPASSNVPAGPADGTLLAAATWETPIALPSADGALQLSCVVEHADGSREEVPGARVTSLHGSMSGTCA